MATNTPLQNLPWRPLPTVDVAGSAFVTIWFTVLAAFIYVWWSFLKSPERVGRARPTWPEFQWIWIATILLVVWYFFALIDRWIHCSQKSVTYGYVLYNPFWEGCRITSSIILLWGTYTIVWREVEPRFPHSHKLWFLAAKVTMLLTAFVSMLQWLLHISFVSVWLQCRSLPTIAGVANVWAGVQTTMTGFLFVFSLVIVIEATAAIIVRGLRRRDGQITGARVLLYIATIVLLARSIIEFCLSLVVEGSSNTRQDLLVVDDIAYGLLTCFYSGLMWAVAWRAANDHDVGGPEALQVKAWIRFKILEELDRLTEKRRKAPPPLQSVLDAVEAMLPRYIAEPRSRESLAWQVSTEYLESLGRAHGHLDPDRGAYTTNSSVGNLLGSLQSRIGAARVNNQPAPYTPRAPRPPNRFSRS